MDSGKEGDKRRSCPRICAWCGRVYLEDQWIPDRRGAAEKSSHGICGPCSRQFLGQPVQAEE